MFDEEVHKNALKAFIAFLRTKTTQKNIAFFSDISREYVRHLGKGEKIPTIRIFFNIIEAAGIDLKEGLGIYIDFLQKQKMALAADHAKGLEYVKKLKSGKIRPKKNP
jgi:hypothetical protein